MLVDDSNRGLGIWNVRKTGTVMWRCNFRPKRNPCKALVSQSGEKFIEHHPHTCKSKEHLKINVLLSARAKKVALENIKEPALKIVEPLIVETLEKNPEWNPVDPDVLARAVARVKSKGIPRNPNHLSRGVQLFLQVQFGKNGKKFSHVFRAN
jgi:hypothetical protein